jgi:hypothetical protein
VIFSNEYVSLATAYLAYVFYLAAVRHPILNRPHLHVADFMSGLFPHYLDRSTMHWAGTYALLPIAGCLAAAMTLLIVGGIITAKQDL